MTDEYMTVDLDEGHLPDVLRISREELGSDYLSESGLKKSLIDKRRHLCRVVTLNTEKAVCGFAMAMIIGPDLADSYLKLPESEERNRLLSLNRLGVLGAAAVDNTKKKMGLGRMLLRSVYSKLLDQSPDVVCAMAWKSIDKVTNAGKILTEMGMKASLEVAGYWNHVAGGLEGHQCPLCGEPPCRCYGVLYTKYLRGD